MPTKSRRRQATIGSRQNPKPFVWFMTGLFLGLCLSIFYIGYDRGLVVISQSADTKEATSEVGDAGRSDSLTFDFYTILPDMEVVVTTEELLGSLSDSEETSSLRRLDGTYVLQVGSFRRMTDADRLKANLALLGLEAHVQTFAIEDEGTWHRVRIGPYTEHANLSEASRILKDSEFNPIILKIKS